MIHEAQTTVRNVGLLIGQKGFYIAGGFLFAALVPRIMGPELYGRYGLVTSLALWFVLFSDPGLTQVIVRYVPQFKLQKSKEDLEKFFGNLLAPALVNSLLVAGLYLILTRLWFRDLDGLLLVTMAGVVLVRAAALPFFSFFLGLNQAARWGINETIRRWLSLALLVPGFYLGALRGACMGLFLSELGILLIGIWWSRPYLSRSSVRLDLPSVIPYLRFGLIFFTTHLLISTFQRSGEVMIRSFHGDYTEVGYFSLAYNVYLAIAMIIPQITLSFVPLSTTLLTRGEIHTLKGWMDQLLKWLGAGSMWVVFGVILLGKDLVPLVLGAAYEPVAADLVPLSLGLLSLILNSIATLLTMVYNQPKVGLIAAGIRLIVFWAFGVPLVARWGSLGACIAVLVSSAIYAGYFTWRMQKTIAYSLSKWALVIVLASLFLPLALLRSTWLINIALYGVFTAGYVSLLFLSRLMTWAEILLLWRTILPGSKKTQQVEIERDIQA